MVKRGILNVPVIGVAKAGWNLEQMRARGKDSLEKNGSFDAAAIICRTLLPLRIREMGELLNAH